MPRSMSSSQCVGLPLHTSRPARRGARGARARARLPAAHGAVPGARARGGWHVGRPRGRPPGRQSGARALLALASQEAAGGAIPRSNAPPQHSCTSSSSSSTSLSTISAICHHPRACTRRWSSSTKSTWARCEGSSRSCCPSSPEPQDTSASCPSRRRRASRCRCCSGGYRRAAHCTASAALATSRRSLCCLAHLRPPRHPCSPPGPRGRLA